MKADFNPYAAPTADVSTPHAPDEIGIWRDGDILVMNKSAQLPDRCLKCNKPANGWRLKWRVSWHRQSYFPIWAKTARLNVPLCPFHRRRRVRLIVAAWLLCLLSPLPMFLAIHLETTLTGVIARGALTAILASLFVGFVAMLVAGQILGTVLARVAEPIKIDKSFVWLSEVDPGFLAELPPWLG